MIDGKLNSSDKKGSIFLGFFLVFFFIVISVFFLRFFKTVEDFSAKHTYDRAKTIKKKVEILYKDTEMFLFYNKHLIEDELNRCMLDNKMVKIEFNEKYITTRHNLVSNYHYVVKKRNISSNVSGTYMNRNELLTDDVKNITVLSESLNPIWAKFYKNYPFVIINYVDRTGFYREFPFRKLEPKSVGYYCEPRNYPYYSEAIASDRNRVFITKPYEVNGNMYFAFAIPVYQKDSFRSLVSVVFSFQRTSDFFEKEANLNSDNWNLILFNKKGDVLYYSFADRKNNVINWSNLNDLISQQKTMLLKNIKLYPILNKKEVVNLVNSFLTHSIKTKMVTVKSNVFIISKLGKSDFYLFLFKNKNNSFLESVVENLRILFLLTILFVVVVIAVAFKFSSNSFCKSPMLIEIATNIIGEKKLSGYLKKFKKQDLTLEMLGSLIIREYEKLKKEYDLLFSLLNTVNMGVMVIEIETLHILFTNKWFRQFFLDANSFELLPEDIREMIQAFKVSNDSRFNKIIRLYERHYRISGEKIEIENKSKRQNLVVLTVVNADDMNKLLVENGELKLKIEEVSRDLEFFKKSFENLNTKLIQSDKFAVFGEMIQGIVHNLNNPMMIVTSRLSMVKSIIEGMQDSLDRKRLLKHIANIIESVKKMNEIIESVLNKARMTVEKDEKLVNVNSLIKSELEFFNADLFFKHKVKKNIELQNPIPFVRISQSDFSQVLHNLIKNSLDALKSSPDPELTIKSYREGNSVVVEVVDNGPGIPENIKDRIFEQYFTTKGSQGTGIGLYNARKIIEEYEGQLILGESEVGARFLIVLPAIGEE